MRRSALQRRTPMSRGSSQLKRSAINPKRTRKRIEGYTDTKYLQACKGEPCYLKVPHVCQGDRTRDTVVAAHSNQAKHGKGMGIKAHDHFTVPACFDCHRWLDQNYTGATKQEKFAAFDSAFAAWLPVRTRKLNGVLA